MSKFFVVVVLALISCSFLASAQFRPAPVKTRDCTKICANPNQLPVCANVRPPFVMCRKYPCEMLRTIETECEACQKNVPYTKGACKPKSI